MELRPLATNVDGSDDTTLDEEATRPRLHKRPTTVCYKVATALCLLLTVTLLVLASRALGIVGSLRQPYAKLYAAAAGNEPRVFPLIDADTHFDVAVSVWQRKPCNLFIDSSANCTDEVWGGGGWRNGMVNGRLQLASTTVPRVDEQLVFSEVVLEDFSLASKDTAVDLDFELPFKFGGAWAPSHYDVRAAVSFLPRSPSRLDRVTAYTAATPEGMVIPPALGKSLTATGHWGAEGSVRRRVLEDMAVHVPLLRQSWYYAEKRIVTRAQVYIVNETHPLKQAEWLASFDSLRNSDDWCGQGRRRHTGFDKGSWHMCFDETDLFQYGSKGHYLGKYEGGSEDGSERLLAYNPFIGVLKDASGPMDDVVVPMQDGQNANGPVFKGAPAANETVVWNPTAAEPLKVNVTLQLSVFNPTKEKLYMIRESIMGMAYSYDDSERTVQAKHDLWEFSNGLFGFPSETAGTWRRVVFVVLHKTLAVFVALLTVLYWYTRRTAAGISHAGIWIRVLVVVPKSIHYVVTGFFHRYPLYGFGPHLVLVLMVVVLCASEMFQLRLVAPIDLRATGWGIQFTGSSAKADHTHTANDPRHEVEVDANLRMKVSWPMRRWTHRERDSRRLEPLLQTLAITGATYLACFVFFYACRGWIIRPRLPLDPDPTTQDFLAKAAKAIGWSGFAAATLLQLRMNRRAGSFAGTYALVAYLQVGIEVCNVLYHFPSVMGPHYVSNGLSVFEASRGVFSLAVLYQAVRLPKVVQNMPDDDE